ncbi:MAG: hypothetical protein ABSF56_01835 [Minisyncoccia bacterium]|jgi:hypothetical protein
MNHENLTGPQLFLRFAWPCASYRLMMGKITQAQYDELEKLVKSETEPDIALLMACFPNAVADLREYAINERRLHDLWSLTTVLGYWRVHKGMEAGCETVKCTVSRCPQNGLDVTASSGGESFRALNPYKLRLYQDDKVLVHQRCVIIKDMSPV